MKSCCDTYCANYGCNQGRDCPVRTERVARIGRKDYAREALPPTAWKRQLRVLAKWMLAVYVLLMLGLIAYGILYYLGAVASIVYVLLK